MLDLRRGGIASSASIEAVFNDAAPGGVLESPSIALLIRLCTNVGIRQHVIETFLELYHDSASDNFDLYDFITLLRQLGWSGFNIIASDAASESSSDHHPSLSSSESSIDHHPSLSSCLTQHVRKTGEMGQFTMLSEIPPISIFSWLSTRSLRLLSWTCSGIGLLTDSQSFFLSSTCVASESQLAAVSLARLYAVCFQHRSLTLRDAAAVSIPAQLSSVLSFLRDAKVRKFAEKIVIYMDLPIICIDVKGNLLGHALNNMCQDWCILSNELTGMTLYNVTTLTIIVTESKRRRIWRESLLVPELSGFEKTLYEAWAASVIATLGTFPNLVSLTVNVKLNGLSRECFWWALRSSLKERFRRITKLRLQSDGEGWSASLVGTRCMASMDHMFEIALKFPSVQRRDFSGPAEVMHRWHGYHDLSEQFTRRIRRMDT